MGYHQVPYGKEPWRGDFQTLLHTIYNLEAEGRGLYQGRYGSYSYDRGTWKGQEEESDLQVEQEGSAQERKQWTGEKEEEESDTDSHGLGNGARLVQCPCGTWHASKTYPNTLSTDAMSAGRSTRFLRSRPEVAGSQSYSCDGKARTLTWSAGRHRENKMPKSWRN